MASFPYKMYRKEVEKEKGGQASDLSTPSVSQTQTLPEKVQRKASSVQSTAGENSHQLFSSFRKKSVLVDCNQTAAPSSAHRIPHRWGSVGTIAPKPPKLRHLVEESGILEDLMIDIQAVSEQQTDNSSAVGKMVDQSEGDSVSKTLKGALHEVLTMDYQDPHLCTYSQVSSLHQQGISSSSQDTAFLEIPIRCIPQFEPQNLDAMQPTHPSPEGVRNTSTIDFAKFSPPHQNPSQPSRSAFPSCHREGRPSRQRIAPAQAPCSKPHRIAPEENREGRPPRQRIVPGQDPASIPTSGHIAPEEHEDIDSAHVPSSIRQFDSMESYQTMVSEITLPTEMMLSLRLDPRAPQYRMAMEQEQQLQDRGEITVRTNNRLKENSPDHPMPPTRRETPQGTSPNPPCRKETPPCKPSAGDTRTEYRIQEGNEGEEKSSVGGHIWGEETSDYVPSNEAQPHGPFVSPESSHRRVLPVLRTPSHDSNPLLFPFNLLSPQPDAPTPQDSTLGPFVGHRVIPQRFLGSNSTPQQDSNPLLFPQGLESFSPSPQKMQQPTLEKEKKQSALAALSPLVLPIDTASESSCLGNGTSEQFSAQTSASTQVRAPPSAVASIRVGMSPREIKYIIDKREYVHRGYYSGPINRRNKMHGNGVFWFTTGDLYLGQFYEGYLHGIGAMSVTLEENGVRQVIKGVFEKNEFVKAE